MYRVIAVENHMCQHEYKRMENIYYLVRSYNPVYHYHIKKEVIINCTFGIVISFTSAKLYNESK